MCDILALAMWVSIVLPIVKLALYLDLNPNP
jgi:hypothetical protein